MSDLEIPVEDLHRYRTVGGVEQKKCDLCGWRSVEAFYRFKDPVTHNFLRDDVCGFCSTKPRAEKVKDIVRNETIEILARRFISELEDQVGCRIRKILFVIPKR